MIATLFLAMGTLFFWMLFSAFTSREIKARGWGFECRIYNRGSEPVMYWLTFSCYLICAVWATAFGILAAIRQAGL